MINTLLLQYFQIIFIVKTIHIRSTVMHPDLRTIELYFRNGSV